MQVRLEGNLLHVCQIPESVDSIRLVLNGIQCLQQQHDGRSTAQLCIKEGVWGPEMASILPGGSKGLLQVYAIDENSTILATATTPNPFVVEQQLPNVTDDTPGRVVGSALQSPRDVHRWEFPPILGKDVPISQLSVVFDLSGVANNVGVIACVHWTLVLGGEWGTINTVVNIGGGVATAKCTPLLPEGWHGLVQCEITASPTFTEELRYAIYREAFDGKRWCKSTQRAAVALPSASNKVRMGKKVAVLVGVSKYTRRPKKRMSDLEYADDDIVQWYHYLRQLGFDCRVFGDEFSPCPGQSMVFGTWFALATPTMGWAWHCKERSRRSA